MNEKAKVRQMVNEIIERGKKAKDSEEFIRTQLDKLKSLIIGLGYSNETIAYLEGVIIGSRGMIEQRNNSGEKPKMGRISTKKEELQTTGNNTISGCASCGGSRSASRC